MSRREIRENPPFSVALHLRESVCLPATGIDTIIDRAKLVCAGDQVSPLRAHQLGVTLRSGV